MRDVFAPKQNRPVAPPDYLSPERWIAHLFSAQAAAKGGVVRRQIRDIERYVGWEYFQDELDRRGYRAGINAGQVVVFCNQEPVYLVERRTSL